MKGERERERDWKGNGGAKKKRQKGGKEILKNEGRKIAGTRGWGNTRYKKIKKVRIKGRNYFHYDLSFSAAHDSHVFKSSLFTAVSLRWMCTAERLSGPEDVTWSAHRCYWQLNCDGLRTEAVMYWVQSIHWETDNVFLASPIHLLSVFHFVLVCRC